MGRPGFSNVRHDELNHMAVGMKVNILALDSASDAVTGWSAAGRHLKARLNHERRPNYPDNGLTRNTEMIINSSRA